MKKIVELIGGVIILGAIWYFVSPLFLNREVDEALPEPTMAQSLTSSDKQEILTIFADRIEKGDIKTVDLPSEQELSSMSDEEFIALEQELMAMTEKDPDTVMDETMPAMNEDPAFPLNLATGLFKGADSFHKGSGKATIIDLDGEKRILRLEDFSVTNGPDLRVYLSSHSSPSSGNEVTKGASVELSKLKGNKGNQNYNIPDDIDIDDFGSVVIYCKPFRVVFATATLK